MRSNMARLSNTTGRIDITSTVHEKVQRFKLTWTEKGGPAVQEPTRRTFGTRLINRLAEQLQGDVRLSPSLKPTARNIARLGERATPAVMSCERLLRFATAMSSP